MATSIFAAVSFGISHTKLYSPSFDSRGMSCQGEISLPAQNTCAESTMALAPDCCQSQSPYHS